MINKIILVGDVWKDPEERTTKKESTMTILSLVTKEYIKNNNSTDKTNNYIEKKEWHTVVAFGESAKYILEKIKKGDVVYLEGKLQTRESIDPNTEKKNYIKEIYLNYGQSSIKKIFSRRKESSADLISLMDGDLEENQRKNSSNNDDNDSGLDLEDSEDLLF